MKPARHIFRIILLVSGFGAMLHAARGAELIFSPDEKYLLCLNPGDAWTSAALRVFPADAGKQDFAATGPLAVVHELAPERGACWLADSRRFVFCRRTGRNLDLWLADATRPERPPQRLTSDPAPDFAPQAGPAPDTIVFCSSRGGDLDVLQLELTTSATAILAGGLQDQCDPLLSPGGRWLYYLSYEQIQPKAFCLELGTGNKIEIPQAVDAKGNPPQQVCWTRDAKRLIFTRTEGRERIFYQFDPLKKETKILTRLIGVAQFALADNAPKLIALGVDGELLAHETGVLGLRKERFGVSAVHPAAFALSPGGKRLALSSGAAVGVAVAPFDKIELHCDCANGTAQTLPLADWLDVYWRSGQPEQARKLFEHNRERANEARAIGQRAEFALALARHGQFDTAQAEFDRLRGEYPARDWRREQLDFYAALQHARPAETAGHLQQSIDGGKLAPADNARAYELLAEIEFDHTGQFDLAWKHYEAARELRRQQEQPAEFRDLPPRHQILHTDFLKLIRVYAEYFALKDSGENSDAARDRRCAALQQALQLRSTSLWALDWIVAESRTEAQRQAAAQLLSRLPANERFTRERVWLSLAELRQFAAAREYFLRQPGALMQDDAVAWRIEDAVRELAYLQPQPPALEDSAAVQLLNANPLIETLAPFFEAPGRDVDYLLALTRLAYIRGNRGKIVESLEAALPRLKQYDNTIAELPVKKMYFWIYTGLANLERGEYARASDAFGQAEKELALAYPAAGSGATGRMTDWRKWKILCATQRALLSQPEFISPQYAAYHRLVNPLLLLPLIPRPGDEQFEQLLTAIYQQLGGARANDLRALYFHAAGVCYRELGRRDLAQASFRHALTLNPASAIRLMCEAELLQLDQLAEDDYLLERSMNAIRQIQPDDALLQQLFSIAQ